VKNAKKIAITALLTACALIVFMIESLFPPLLVVGAKVGLSNIFVMLALILLDLPYALIVTVTKCLLGCAFTGTLSSLIYSLGGGLVSLGIVALLYYIFYPSVSLVSLSVVGAVMHNVTQNLLFILISQTPLMLSYLPYLTLVGILAGVIVGSAVHITIKTIPLSTYEKLLS